MRSVTGPFVDSTGGDRDDGAVPDAGERGDPAPAPGEVGADRRSRASLWAALFVLPYVLFGVAWVFSNPPGAAPDEPDHLIKALGMADLDIGRDLDAPLPARPLLVRRNLSISREVDIPARLAPDGYACFAFNGTATAACLPHGSQAPSGTVTRATPIGAYPPFEYVPMGLAARLANTPDDAFRAARLVALATAGAVLFVGARILVRQLGRAALLGALVALTPMAVFAASSVTTSGVEIVGGFTIGAIVAVCARRPEALLRPGTQLALAGVGSVLVLSRQTGVVTLGVMLVLLAFVAWPQVRRIVREHRPPFVVGVAMLGVSVAALGWWERTFDHPTDAGTPWNVLAVRPFIDQGEGLLNSAVGVFGWLDTPLPLAVLRFWLALGAVLVIAALAVGTGRDRAVLGGAILATGAVAFASYAVVFFPVGASSQGRHLLPLLAFCPLYAGVVVVDRLRSAGHGRAVRPLLVGIAAAAGLVQLLGLYTNGRRYAVGVGGPWNFFGGAAEWTPPLGWPTWLVLGLVAAAVLVAAALVGPLDPSPPLHAETEVS